MFKVGAFGDASLPEIFTYLTTKYQRDIKYLKIPMVRYIDDMAFGLGKVPKTLAETRWLSTQQAGKKQGWVWSRPKQSGPIKKKDFLGFEVDTEKCCMSLATKRKEKIRGLWEKIEMKTFINPKVWAKAAGMMVAAKPVCKPAMAWAAAVFQKLHKTDWTTSLVKDTTTIEAMKEFLRYIETTPIEILRPLVIDWSIIGDAVPGKVAAILYKGEVPYTKNTKVSGVKKE